MNNLPLKTKLITFFNTYKWLLVPLIPIMLFVSFIIYLSFPQATPQQVPETSNSTNSPIIQPNGTVIPTGKSPQISGAPIPTSFSIPSARIYSDEYETELETPIESLPGYQKKELLPNGLTKYTLTSTNPNRPDIYIMQDDNILLERKITSPQLGVKIHHYTDVYGLPDEQIEGPSFYGNQAEEYIYATMGVAFIADPVTGNVLETRLFPPMSVADYITNIRVYE